MANEGAAFGQRSDTMMRVHVPVDRKIIVMMSIMRETWVDIPGHGQAKINAAMAFGDVPMVVQTLLVTFNARLDDVSIAFTSPGQRGFTFAAGSQRMNGDQELAFVRER